MVVARQGKGLKNGSIAEGNITGGQWIMFPAQFDHHRHRRSRKRLSSPVKDRHWQGRDPRPVHTDIKCLLQTAYLTPACLVQGLDGASAALAVSKICSKCACTPAFEAP